MSKKEALGLSTNLFVNPLPHGDIVVIGGTVADEQNTSVKWTRILSRRAAHLLWYHLTRLLFPEKAPFVTAIAMTAPIRNAAKPTITSHIEAEKSDEHRFDIMGVMGNNRWGFEADAYEAQRLWAGLDRALYPDGWQEEEKEKEKTSLPEQNKPSQHRAFRRQSYQ